MASCLKPDGELVWQKRVCEFKPDRYKFGYGASPIPYDGRLLIAAEYDGPQSGLYALDLKTGQTIWRATRPASNLSFASPAVKTIGGRAVVLMPGAGAVTAYDPADGRVVWRIPAGTAAHCGTAVTSGDRVMISGGFPDTGTWCVEPSGRSGRVVWKERFKAYEQSPIVVGEHVYTIADGGVAYCNRINDGSTLWRTRLLSSKISASPLLVGNRLIAADERGGVVIFDADPNEFKEVFRTQVGDAIFASPVVVGDTLYLRTAVGGASKREYLIAIGDQ